MKKLFYLTIIILTLSCNRAIEPRVDSIWIQIGDEKSIAHFDQETNSYIIELDPNENWERLSPIIEFSSNLEIKPQSGSIQNLNNPIKYSLINEEGQEYEFLLKAFTTNLLLNPQGKIFDDSWQYGKNSGVEIINDECFFYTKGFLETECENLYSSDCYGSNQVVNFNKDYSNKIVLYASNSWPEKVFENSITGHPYLWGMQYGTFPLPKNDLRSLFRTGMRHTENEKTWQKIGNYFPLFENVDSVLFRMHQAKRNGDDPNGSKSLFKNIECRVFEDSLSAQFYFEHLFKE